MVRFGFGGKDGKVRSRSILGQIERAKFYSYILNQCKNTGIVRRILFAQMSEIHQISIFHEIGWFTSGGVVTECPHGDFPSAAPTIWKAQAW